MLSIWKIWSLSKHKIRLNNLTFISAGAKEPQACLWFIHFYRLQLVKPLLIAAVDSASVVAFPQRPNSQVLSGIYAVVVLLVKLMLAGCHFFQNTGKSYTFN